MGRLHYANRGRRTSESPVASKRRGLLRLGRLSRFIGACGIGSGQLFRLLPPGRRQRLSFARLARLVQRLDSLAVALLVGMVVTLCHCHRLMAGKVVDLLYGDAEVEHSCDKV